ncbi:MAG TPA: enoyl-CoA hydratase/isomerase family protein [Candidatus Eisenbacteria bacterium]|nr:enoyl-CoA hydratase/isomerase family protein [Candidatus Eisenbacteria bacterium]
MHFVRLSINEGIAEVRLKRGKVNALNEQAVEEIDGCFHQIAADPEIKAVIFTGDGPFFSFGFDIPEFLGYSKESFSRYLRRFTGLYTYLFTFPKPLVAALNGHAIAAGCMLALTCDYRIMVSGKAKISLNEITFGSSVFAGSVAMLQSLVGGRNAHAVLYDGTMYSAQQALQLGMIDQVSSDEDLLESTLEAARRLAAKDAAAFRSIKSLLRAPVANEMARKKQRSVKEFVDIWYSENIWRNLQAIEIRS